MICHCFLGDVSRLAGAALKGQNAPCMRDKGFRTVVLQVFGSLSKGYLLKLPSQK